MTIKKSYRFQIEHEDGSIEDVIFKGRTEPEAREALKQEYPDLDWYDWGDRLKITRSHRVPVFSRVFYNSRRRGAQFIYRHKGRKKRGRKNYPTPKGGWRRPLGPMSFTFTETISMSVRDSLKKWVDLLGPDPGLTVQMEVQPLPAFLQALLPEGGDTVLLGDGKYRVTFSFPPCQLMALPPENDMQQQTKRGESPFFIHIDSLGMLPEVQAEQAACPPCIPTTAIDELGRALKDLNIGDRMLTKIPTDEELIASGDPDSPLTKALQCRVNGDYIGMMLHAENMLDIKRHILDDSVKDLYPDVVSPITFTAEN